MSKGLFDEFDAVSTKQWKQKIQFDLKGADYNDTLIWKTNEDISIKPFYNADDFDASQKILDTKATQWKVCQTIYVADVLKSNQKAFNILERGAESIRFIIPSSEISIKDLVKGIDTNKILLVFELHFLSDSFVENLQNLIPKSKISIDIIGQLAKTGNWFNHLNDDFKKLESITKK